MRRLRERQTHAKSPTAREAIRYAVEALGENDALVIAGKGHENYQIIGSEVHPFSDRDEAVKAARAVGGMAVSEAA